MVAVDRKNAIIVVYLTIQRVAHFSGNGERVDVINIRISSKIPISFHTRSSHILLDPFFKF